MRYTIWSNGGRYEWLLYDGDQLVRRSGLVFASRTAAKRALLGAMALAG